jgi:hypothetical protein
MTAAALERFINDAVGCACRAVTATHWSELVPGQRRYLFKQFAFRLHRAADSLLKTNKIIDRLKGKLQQSITDCATALTNPSTWSDSVELGMFLDGQAAPERIATIVGQFDGTGCGIFDLLEDRGWDKAAILRSLTQLIDARHGVAHALQGAPAVSPQDARSWLVSSCRLAVHIDDFLKFAPAGVFPHCPPRPVATASSDRTEPVADPQGAT